MIIRARQKGVAVVEAAIILPIVMLLALSAGEFGRAFVQYSRLTHRVQSAARFVAGNALQGSTGVAELTDSVKVQALNMILYQETLPGTTSAVPGLTSTDIEIVVTTAGLVSVSIDYKYQPVVADILLFLGNTGDFSMSSISLRPRAVMRAL